MAPVQDDEVRGALPCSERGGAVVAPRADQRCSREALPEAAKSQESTRYSADSAPDVEGRALNAPGDRHAERAARRALA